MGIMFIYLFQTEIQLHDNYFITFMYRFKSISRFAVMLKLIMNDIVQYLFYFLHFLILF